MICLQQIYRLRVKGAWREILSVPYGFFEDCIRVLERGDDEQERVDVMRYWLCQLYGISLEDAGGWEEFYYSICDYMQNIGDSGESSASPDHAGDSRSLYDALFDMSMSACSTFHLSPFELRSQPLHEVISLFNRIIRKGRGSKKADKPADKYISQAERILPDGTREIRRRVYADNF